MVKSNMRSLVVLIVLMTSSCYAEWDVPKVPRRDPCTHAVDDAYVYVNPTCRDRQLQIPYALRR